MCIRDRMRSPWQLVVWPSHTSSGMSVKHKMKPTSASNPTTVILSPWRTASEESVELCGVSRERKRIQHPASRWRGQARSLRTYIMHGGRAGESVVTILGIGDRYYALHATYPKIIYGIMHQSGRDFVPRRSGVKECVSW